MASDDDRSVESLEGQLIALLRHRSAEAPIRLEVHHYFHQPLRLVASEGPPWLKAATIALSTGKENATMTTPSITVDETGHLSPQFDDDKGDTDAAAPSGTVATWSVAPDPNSAVTAPATTVAPDPANALDAIATPGPEGDAGLFVLSFNGTALEPDGVTAIADPAPLAFLVGPGGAVSASIVETNS